jgi:hypothetical protein
MTDATRNALADPAMTGQATSAKRRRRRWCSLAPTDNE